MFRILFICHGNICRSAAAEMIMKQLVASSPLAGKVLVDSAAVTTDALGWDIYGPMKKALTAHGVKCEPHVSRQIVEADYERYDLLIGMDHANLRGMRRLWSDDAAGKLRMLAEYANRPGEEIDDPWYTLDFDRAYREIAEGCEGLLGVLQSNPPRDIMR